MTEKPLPSSPDAGKNVAAFDPNAMEVAEGRAKEQLEGWIPSLASNDEIRDALEKAFDYRGDVTLTLKDGRVVQGYVFDRRTGKSLEDSVVRVIPAGERSKLSIAYSQIAALAFTGRDNAAGRTFDAWIRKYWERKAAGEKNIGIQAEQL
jgi:transcriptional antiterminator Rof (Rho-off)